jgi:hypothetical protein
MKVNGYNFLSWFDGNASTAQPDLPHAYWKDRESCGFMPIGYPTETMSFYINTPLGANYGTFSDLKLAIVHADGTIANFTAGILSQHMLTSPNYNIYSTFTLPVVPDGIYYLMIYHITGGAEVLRSSYILVRNDKTNLDNETVYCKFRHDRFFYNIKYADLPTFYQQFRIPMSIIERQTESDREVYNEVTTGKPRTLQSFLKRWERFETYYLDPQAHEAVSIMLEHNHVELNGNLRIIKEAYKEPNNPLSKIGKGEFTVWDADFASVNRC